MKRRLIVLSIFFLFFAAFIGVKPPQVAHASSCSSATFSAPSTFTVTLPANGGAIHFSLAAGQTVNLIFLGPITIPGPNPGFSAINGLPSPLAITITLTGSGSVTFTGSSPFFTCPNSITSTNFTDGRLNSHDPWETDAIYCLGDGSVRVYVIGNPNWTIDFTASPAEIGKDPQKPSHNMLIKGGHFANLSRLTNGLLQVTAPGLNPKDGDYVFMFQDCPLPAAK